MDSDFLGLAAAEAEKFEGATAPNPPVGACIVRDGGVLGVGAHARAGTDHAEVVAIKAASGIHGAQALRGSTIYVTLEPCNHHGRTPPCVSAIVEAGFARVVYAMPDPNPNVKGGGAQALRQAGLIVDQRAHTQSTRLLDGFGKRARTGKPWLVHKLAYRFDERGTLTMIPQAREKTFTRPESLKVAHLERRRSDAIITGLGTILRDAPAFNVRNVEDHPAKRRLVAVVSRSGARAPAEWIARQSELGHEVLHASTLVEALQDLGHRGVLRVLAECGPRLSEAIVSEQLWDEKLVIIHRENGDEVNREFSCSQES